MALTSPTVNTISPSMAMPTEIPGPGRVRPAEPCFQEGGLDGAEQLGHDVGRHSFRREVASQGEGDGDGRVEVGSADGAHKQDEGHHHEGWGDHRGPVGERVAAEAGADHSATDRYQHQQKRSEQP
jgi:hypothetical protein